MTGHGRHGDRLADLRLAGAVELGELRVRVDAVAARDLRRDGQARELLGAARQRRARVELQRLHFVPGARQRLLRKFQEELRHEAQRLRDVGPRGGGRGAARLGALGPGARRDAQQQESGGGIEELVLGVHGDFPSLGVVVCALREEDERRPLNRAFERAW